MVIVVAPLAPSTDITNCAKPEYRQEHLAQCNKNDTPGGTGGPRPRGGLIGGLLGALGL
ncbi:hypothetical protein ACQ856_18050 [Mycolicibacterium psychrotolerans]|uniref:hypothetical protein n=1 Tax=Mycolicibacterium psychrotolerans TaxID=216929 RepID=UPI003D672366